MRGFGQAFDLLRQHPKAGAAWPKLGEDIRCLVHRRHRIFYQEQDGTVLIVRVVHHAMDEQRVLRGGARRQARKTSGWPVPNAMPSTPLMCAEREGVLSGKGVSVRVDIGGRYRNKKKK